MIMGLGCLSENWEIQVRRDQCVEYFEGTLVIQISINKSKPARLNMSPYQRGFTSLN